MQCVVLVSLLALLLSCSNTRNSTGRNNVVVIKSKNSTHASTGTALSRIEGNNNLIEINYDSSSYLGKNSSGLTVLHGDGNHVIVNQNNVHDRSENNSDTVIIKANKEKIALSGENIIDSSKNQSRHIEIDLTDEKPVASAVERKKSKSLDFPGKANNTGNRKSGTKSAEPVYEKLEELEIDSLDFIKDTVMIRVEGKEEMMKISKAFSYYFEQIKDGNPRGYYQIGVFYQSGIGTPINSLKAADYLEIAARKGVAEAQYNLGFIYEKGFFKVEENKEKAAYYYKLAAAQGYKDAISRLEEMNQ